MKNNKDRKPQKLLLAIFAVAIFAGFGLVGIERASAADCHCYVLKPWVPDPKCVDPEPASRYCLDAILQATDSNNCNQLCAQQFQAWRNDPEKNVNLAGIGGTMIQFSNQTPEVEPVGQGISQNMQGTQTVADKNRNTNDSCVGWTGFFAHPLNCTLIPILKLMGTLLSVAATIFGWIIDAEGLKAVLNNNIIYRMWALVRDTLNISFILVLLFSAFCTVFQIEKFSYKKILLTLIIMALLVNFSFPIARVIIDFSNVLMYYFLQTLPGFNDPTLPGFNDPNKLFTTIAGIADLNDIVYPSATADTTMLIAAIIFSFILAVTFIIIAILLVIRTVALAIIIIFSPIAFVGSIVPIFSKYSSQWWDSLFKYSFFGPIMVFMLYLATNMMQAIKIKGFSGKNTFVTIANSQSSSAELIASMAFYVVPLVILWMGIGIAQKMSIAGAAEVTGKGKKFMQWAGGKASGYNFMKSQYDSFSKSRKARRAEIESNRYGGSIGKWLNRKQDTALGVVSSAARDRVRDAERKEVQELRDKWKKNGGVSDVELNSTLNSRNSAKRKAAAMEMMRRISSATPSRAPDGGR